MPYISFSQRVRVDITCTAPLTFGPHKSLNRMEAALLFVAHISNRREVLADCTTALPDRLNPFRAPRHPGPSPLMPLVSNTPISTS
ncbi:hypothetical protein L596_000556 [Steinernema carpocapsae]|uniref:Uncharacterized protein n=1 Tax=Steinernema carpocapsae TaxID=34508 RepID=A0A4V6I752_STECR|nr:hypothetical protein L596_000556 [Steinernema carpocapsae]